MARLAGVDLPRDKRVEIGLTYIYGIGRTTSNRILKDANVDPSTRVRDLTDEEVTRIKDVMDSTCTVEGDLRRHPSQKRPSGPRSEHQEQCENPQGPETHGREQEEVIPFRKPVHKERKVG